MSAHSILPLALYRGGVILPAGRNSLLTDRAKKNDEMCVRGGEREREKDGILCFFVLSHAVSPTATCNRFRHSGFEVTPFLGSLCPLAFAQASRTFTLVKPALVLG